MRLDPLMQTLPESGLYSSFTFRNRNSGRRALAHWALDGWIMDAGSCLDGRRNSIFLQYYCIPYGYCTFCVLVQYSNYHADCRLYYCWVDRDRDWSERSLQRGLAKSFQVWVGSRERPPTQVIMCGSAWLSLVVLECAVFSLFSLEGVIGCFWTLAWEHSSCSRNMWAHSLFQLFTPSGMELSPTK